MENKQFIYNPKIIWIYLISSYLLVFVGSLAKLEGWEFSEVTLASGIILFFLTWLIIVIDIVKTSIFNKTFWIISIIVLPQIASLFYMIQRNKLLRSVS